MSQPYSDSDLAVALSRTAADGSVRVTAKGRGALAEQIREIAFAQGVAVRRDADLAEILDAVEIDCEIPAAALGAVAEILNRLYQANLEIAS
ncbi:flagellar biosynthesis protein [Tistlia consotensis]|uniref:Flagellar biosynthesis protein n=1 Tax=Tistlia consotensis USBA 355 TaxID=560819 RepID=A0A1Y6CIL1_9PROT|nr:EscU/YscU/HrcU family type III secretion system export apparatus switch protein [Tistlia consotensis]SMF68137.1 flagellar biosynthesis protein [Tistlia consotensis USBA 355]SNR99015.1 flagellar biosynthesis protein [Tistlia consotensis]